MDYLQEGIGLRAMAQRDPLVEYQREGFDMFAAMMGGIKEESVGFLFSLEVQVGDGSGAAAARAKTAHSPRLTVGLSNAASCCCGRCPPAVSIIPMSSRRPHGAGSGRPLG